MLKIRHIALLACLAAPLAMAAEEGAVGHPPTGEHMVPPPEAAFKACEGKQVGDRATFSKADGKSVSGVCRNMEGKLAVMPEHGRMGPPPGALKACEGKQVGDSGSFTGPDGRTFSGTCSDMGGKLTLMPEPADKSGKHGNGH